MCECCKCVQFIFFACLMPSSTLTNFFFLILSPFYSSLSLPLITVDCKDYFIFLELDAAHLLRAEYIHCVLLIFVVWIKVKSKEIEEKKRRKEIPSHMYGKKSYTQLRGWMISNRKRRSIIYHRRNNLCNMRVVCFYVQIA